MRLKQLKIKGFRKYKDLTTIDFDNLTAFIGKNDAGKSSILEALEIFFNSNLVKIEKEDLCVSSETNEMQITCVFDDVPEEIILDSSPTLTSGEYILNPDGFLEIEQIFDCSLKTPKLKIFAFALHPANIGYDDLLELKNDELKKRATELRVEISDKRKNSIIRKEIWAANAELTLSPKHVPLEKEDANKIWGELKKALPLFALFQSDRKNRDDDQEVQDPLKLAVIEALKDVESQLEQIRNTVKDYATKVAERTLEKLQEMAPTIAHQLRPEFEADQKWQNLFKLTFRGNDDIPINKRGSGVRRLILLNFFRAEVEKRKAERNAQSIIYAFEEPETSQHPNNQILLVEALKELSDQENCQVNLTTHTPALAGILPTTSFRYVDFDTSKIICNSDEVFEEIANTLGILPDPVDKDIQLFICVEGSNDINFLKNISIKLNQEDPEILDLSSNPKIIFISLGGSALKDWVNKNYLQKLGIPELHIYDLDDPLNPKYQRECDSVNARGNGHIAFLTKKREMENYLHPDAIREVYGFDVAFSDFDDVGEIVARTVYELAGSGNWTSLSDESRKEKIKRAKNRLNREAASKMTKELVNAVDSVGELAGWFAEIKLRITN